jgi:hypothetical protein
MYLSKMTISAHLTSDSANDILPSWRLGDASIPDGQQNNLPQPPHLTVQPG